MAFEILPSYVGMEDEVLCVWSKAGKVYGGGDDGICIWDASTREKICNVPSKCFKEEAVMSIVSSVKNEQVFYASAGSMIFYFDHRQLTEPLHYLSFNMDEINQLSLNDKGTLLAACDDATEIKIIDVSARTATKTLKNKHKNIVNTVQFRRKFPYHLLSGALDSSVCYWDASRGSCFSVIDTNDATGDEPDVTTAINPSFVYSIACHSKGNMFAAALGNGVVCAYNFGSSHKEPPAPVPLIGGHSSAVSQVIIPECGGENLMISGGNDKNICAWELDLTDQGRCTRGRLSARFEYSTKINYLATNNDTTYVVGQTPDIGALVLRP